MCILTSATSVYNIPPSSNTIHHGLIWELLGGSGDLGTAGRIFLLCMGRDLDIVPRARNDFVL